MRPDLSVWFKSPTGTRQLPLVRVDARFQVPGGVFATIITQGPVTLIARDASGRTIYTAPVTNRGDKASFCGGRDGGNPPVPPALAKLDVKPRFIRYPFGPFRTAHGP